jgi:hypothetical protein
MDLEKANTWLENGSNRVTLYAFQLPSLSSQHCAACISRTPTSNTFIILPSQVQTLISHANTCASQEPLDPTCMHDTHTPLLGPKKDHTRNNQGSRAYCSCQHSNPRSHTTRIKRERGSKRSWVARSGPTHAGNPFDANSFSAVLGKSAQPQHQKNLLSCMQQCFVDFKAHRKTEA